MTKKEYGILSLPVIVGSLGFFVDIYDLLLFSIVRKKSLHDLNVPDTVAKEFGESVVSWQMLGLVIGGILWGMLGDKKAEKVYFLVLSYCILQLQLLMALLQILLNIQSYVLLRA